jgi:uncharacterized membrane protein YphA (DoxX/SURF4 family)
MARLVDRGRRGARVPSPASRGGPAGAPPGEAAGPAPRRRAVWAVFAARLAVGVIFLLAGVAKLASPGTFTATLLAYDVLPVGLLRPLALILPWVEVVVGLYLLVGLFARPAAWVAIALLAVFMGAIGQAVLRGLSLEDCGCFGSLTAALPALQYVLGGSSLGPADVLRDGVYAALALVVALGPPAPWGVDAWLASRRPAD